MDKRKNLSQIVMTRQLASKAQVAEMAEKLNAGYDRQLSGHILYHSCVWGYVAAEWSECGHAEPCPLPEVPTMGTWVLKLDHGAVEEGGLIWQIMWWLCVCVLYLGKKWHQEATGKGEKLEQCDAPESCVLTKGTSQRVQGVTLASRFHPSQWDREYMECAGKTSVIHGGSVLKGFV